MDEQQQIQWVLNNLQQRAKDAGVIWQNPDPLPTIAELDKISDNLDNQIAEKYNSLPVDEENSIFSKENTVSFLHAVPSGHGSITNLVLTIEKLPDGLNVCMEETKDNTGNSTINCIEIFATNIYATKLNLICSDPNKISWYIHRPAKAIRNEMFMHVPMTFGSNGFEKPDFKDLKKVPETVKMALFNVNYQDDRLLEGPTEEPVFQLSPKSDKGLIP